MTPQNLADFKLADNFDAPIIEPVTLRNAEGGIERLDVSFIRADMDYWQQWAEQLAAKRRTERENKLGKQLGLDAVARARVQGEILKLDVQIFEVLDQQYYPAGIKKILDDALARGGMSDGAQRKRILKAIPPSRQQLLASEVCSEPRATVEQLREGIRQLAFKLGIGIAAVNAMNDEQLINFAGSYQPPAPPESGQPPVPGDEGEDEQANPTVPGDAAPGAQ